MLLPDEAMIESYSKLRQAVYCRFQRQETSFAIKLCNAHTCFLIVRAFRICQMGFIRWIRFKLKAIGAYGSLL